MGGEGIKSAQATSQKDSYGNTQYVVSLMFTDDGAKAFAEATARNIGKPIYIIYDGKIISYPTVNQAITNGQCVIEGNFTYDDVNSLATTIRAGVLKLQLNEISSKVVSAKLGDEAVKTSLMAGAIGLADRYVVYDRRVLDPGCGCSPCTASLRGSNALLPKWPGCDTDTAWYRRYHPFRRYGGGCQCHYLYAN